MNVSIGGIAKTVEITSFDKLGDVKVCMLTTTADGSVGFQQLNDEVRDTIYASFPVDTASGDIASFEDGADNVPVRKLMLNLVPYQGGSGDPAPDNVRPIYPANGINVLQNPYSSGETLTTNGITFTVNTDGSVSVKGTATGNADLFFVGASGVYEDAHIKSGDYRLTLGRKGGMPTGTYVRFYVVPYGGTAEYATDATADDATFDATATYRIFIRVSSGATVDAVYYPMISSVVYGHESYAPYKGFSVTRTGKNVLPAQLINATVVGVSYSLNTDGSVTASGTSTSGSSGRDYVVSGYRPPNGTYTLSGGTADVGVRINRYTKDGTLIDRNTSYETPLQIVIDDSVGYIYCGVGYVSANKTVNTTIYPQLELGTTATAYELYQGEVFCNVGDQDYYGGTLDVVSGVLMVNKTAIDMGSIAWTYYTGASAPMFYGDLPNGKNNNTNGGQAYIDISSCYKRSSSTVVEASTFATNGTDGSFAQNTNAQCRMLIKDNRYSTGSDLQTAVTGQTVVYELATPLVYQLTPVQVKTLLGYNNIWTDSGTVEVQYRANIGLYIQKIIGSSEDDMVANQNIAANQYFFVGEELYYSTSAISAGQTIIVGTNCIKTTLADALNALNS